MPAARGFCQTFLEIFSDGDDGLDAGMYIQCPGAFIKERGFAVQNFGHVADKTVAMARVEPLIKLQELGFRSVVHSPIPTNM